MSKNVQGRKTDLLSLFSPPSRYQPHHFILHVSTLENNISPSAKFTYTTMSGLNSPFNLPQRMHTILCPSRPRTTYRHPQNERTPPSTFQNLPANGWLCHAPHVFPTVPTSVLGLKTTYRLPKLVLRHAPASGTLPPRHGSANLRDDVSQSAKRPLFVLASLSNRSRIPPGPKTIHRLPQHGRAPSFSFRDPSTSPWVSEASRRRIPVRSTPSRRAGQFFQPFHIVLYRPWPQDDVSSSAKWSDVTLELQKPLHPVIDSPGFDTMYSRPLTALSVLGSLTSFGWHCSRLRTSKRQNKKVR